MDSDFISFLLTAIQASSCKELEVIQSLWSGYGKISRYGLENSKYPTVVVKHIAPNKSTEHPRGWNTNQSHQRKLASYEVEDFWYNHWSSKTNEECRIPKHIGSYSKGPEQWIILEDLDIHFPLRKEQLNLKEVKQCMAWLANFHGTFMGSEPRGLWQVGTYWNLDTRPEEFEQLTHQGLKERARQIDQLLNNCKYKTIIHGDAKLANFCFSENGRAAAVDFQYVGGGCGMKDFTYFLGSCLSAQNSEKYEAELLDFYFTELNKSMVISNEDFTQIEKEWRGLYNLASADFMRFMLGWMPTHHKVNDYAMEKVNQVLNELTELS